MRLLLSHATFPLFMNRVSLTFSLEALFFKSHTQDRSHLLIAPLPGATINALLMVTEFLSALRGNLETYTRSQAL